MQINQSVSQSTPRHLWYTLRQKGDFNKMFLGRQPLQGVEVQ